jgi:hypothetical protein
MFESCSLAPCNDPRREQFFVSQGAFLCQWRTVHVLGDIRGKAALFKSIAKNQDVTRSQFHRLSVPLTLAQAVALAEQPSLP